MTSFRASRRARRQRRGDPVPRPAKGRQTGETGQAPLHAGLHPRQVVDLRDAAREPDHRPLEPALPLQRDARTGAVPVPSADPARGELPLRDGAVAIRPRHGPGPMTTATLAARERILRYMSRLRSHITYANVMATIALFIALGGTSYAVSQLPRNSVGAKQIRSECGRRLGDPFRRRPVAATSQPLRCAAGHLARRAAFAPRTDRARPGPQGRPVPPDAARAPRSTPAAAYARGSGRRERATTMAARASTRSTSIAT